MLRRKNNTKILGNSGEDFACKLLMDQGYQILSRNFCSKFGELDIVAVEGDTIVFVEVKTRRGTKQGLPEEAVTESKLTKIRQTAEYYLQKTKYKFEKQRIEVIALLLDGSKISSVKHIKVVSI